MDPLAHFREIWLVDTEFVAKPSQRPAVVCVAAVELRTGRTIALFHDELDATPPYPVGDDTLFVSFAAAAELEVHLALGWPLPRHVLDLRVEHLVRGGSADKPAGSTRKKPPRSLIDVLRHYGIPDGDAAEKDRIRTRIIKGGFPFTVDERAEILRYCLSDADALGPLLKALLPGIRHLGQALSRGAYVAFTAEVSHTGIPFDTRAMTYLQRPEIRQALRLRLVADKSLTQGLYDGATLRQSRLAEFDLRRGLRWERTPTGRLSTSASAFERIARDHPEFTGLAEIQKTLALLHEFGLAVGDDGRCRTPIWGFSTITGRMAPAGSSYPFTTAGWTRFLIQPPAGTSLAYLDFSSMEFGVAAGLSRCPQMLDDYRNGDPYLGLAIQAGLAPAGATAATHADLRNKFKSLVLALQYGGGGALLAHRLKTDRRTGDRLVELHKQRYAAYWRWSDQKLATAFEDGELVARDGWRCGAGSWTSEFTARNWLIQANSGGLFRCAGLMAQQLGIKVCAVVHDALLIEAPTDRIEVEAARATTCLERASKLFLHDLVLRVDTKIIRENERFGDKRGIKIWDYVEKTLCEIEKGMVDAA